MEELKKILYEMNYIYDIFDDIRNLYHSLKYKEDIYNIYNNDDLTLLDKISVLCNHMIYFDRMTLYDDELNIFKMKKEIFCDELLNTYNLLENTNKETNSLREALRYRNEFFIYDNKDYIYYVKNNLNIILNNIY